MIKALKVFTLVIVCMMFMVAVTGYAQQVVGTIVGTVKDATGAVVNTATVTATGTDNGFSRSVPTNGAGEYRIDNLPVGRYTITVSAPSFESFTQQNLALDVDQTMTVAVKLTAGAESTTVTVTSAPPQINTSTAEIGRTLTGEELTQLPLVNRDPYSELSLVPGVGHNSSDDNGSSKPNFVIGLPSTQVQINGSIDGGNPEVGFYLDGADNITGIRNYGNLLPQPDALAEFRVETNSFAPQYGHFSAAVITAITKSGSNSFHGGLFEFHRETFLNDTQWGAAQSAKTPYHRNNFGIYLGGPIVKDKAFLFLSLAGLQQSIGTNFSNSTVPTDAERLGDFTGDTFLLYNPKPANVAPATWYVPANRAMGINSSPNCLVATLNCMNNAAHAVVGAANLDPSIQGILAADIVHANIAQTTAQQATGGAGYTASSAVPTTNIEYLIKFTSNLTQKDQLGVTYFYITTKTSPFNSGATPYGTTLSNTGQTNGIVNWVHTFTPNVQNNLILAFTRSAGGRTNVPKTALGSFGSNFLIQGDAFLPDLSINGASTFGGGLAGPVTTSNWLELRDVFTVVRGKHSLTFGGSIASDKGMFSADLNNFGIFNFQSGTYNAITGATSGAAQSTTTGVSGGPTIAAPSGIADFIAGQVNNMEQDTPYHTLLYAWHTGIFVNDSYRATPRLTLNLGIRWDIDTAPIERQNLTAAWVPGQTSTVSPTLAQGLLVPGDSGISRGIIQTRYSHLAPRLGIAWDPFGDGKTAIRAGAGVFFGSTSGNEWNQPGNSYPFALRPGTVFHVRSVTDVYNATLNDNTTASSFNGTAGGGVFPYTFTPGVAPLKLNQEGIETISPGFKWPYSYQFNVAVQRQLPLHISATVAYVAALSHSVPTMVDNNYAPYTTAFDSNTYATTTGAPCGAAPSTSASCTEARRPYDSGYAPIGLNGGAPAPGTGQVGPYQGCVNGNCSAALTANGAYPNAGTLGQNTYLRSDQTASYHSLQISATRPMTHNVQVSGSYTWSHALQSSNESAIGLIAAQDYNNLREERGPMSIDQRNAVTVSALWKINYYHGSNFAMKEAFNGWSISPVWFAHTGNPFEITSGNNNNFDSSNHNRPNAVPGINPLLSHHRCRVGCSNSETAPFNAATGSGWFNASAYVQNAVGAAAGIGPGNADGNVGWDTGRAPGYRNVDLGVYRDVGFSHGVNLQLRLEATNAFNIVSLNGPSSSIGTASTVGRITAASSVRLIQIGGKLSF